MPSDGAAYDLRPSAEWKGEQVAHDLDDASGDVIKSHLNSL